MNNNIDLAQHLAQTSKETLGYISRNKEALLMAFIAETGLKPSESCICCSNQLVDGNMVFKIWVERRDVSP